MGHKMRVLILILAVFLVSCGESSSQTMMTADFSTMSACVSRMEGVSGPLNIITDNENNVSGRLANGKAFGCTAKESGTQGRYIQGFYQP